MITNHIEIMAVRNYLPYQGINNLKALLLEKRLLEKNYDFLKVKVIDNILYCEGVFRPVEESEEYRYVLKFSVGKHPRVYVKEPIIQYNDDIHMYSSDNSLCLYYPKDFNFTDESHLYDTIVPWIHEWFVFYELYLIKGKWLHPYVEHKKL